MTVFATVVLTVALAALIFSLRFPVVQDPLGDIITAVANKPGDFFVRVGKVRGKLPWDMQVDRVEIGDGEGVWMVIEDAQAAWHPFDLWDAFARTHLRIAVDHIHARHLLWTRLPVDDPNDPEPFDWSTFPRILVGDLQVDEFEVGGELLGGGHAVFRASGNGVLGEWEHGRLDLTLARVDGKRSDIKIDLASSGDPPDFHGNVVASEEAAGDLAWLARLPDAGAVDLRLDVSGPLRDWNVKADVHAGAIGKLDATANVAFGPTGAFRVSGSFDPVAAQRERYLVGPGSPLRVAARGAWIPDEKLTLDEVRLDADGRVLQGAGQLDLATKTLPFSVAATLSRPGSGGQQAAVVLGPLLVNVARLEGAGTLGAANGPAFHATLQTEGLGGDGFAFDELRAVVAAEQTQSEGPLVFDLDVTSQGLKLADSVDSIAAPVIALIGDAPWLKGRGTAALADGVVSFERIDAGGLAVVAGGTVAVADDWNSVRGVIDVDSADLSELSDWLGSSLEGRAQLHLTLDAKQGGDIFEAVADAKATSLVFGDPGLQALVGAQMTMTAQASGTVRGPAQGKGRVDADGIRGDIDAKLLADGRSIEATFTAALDNLARLSTYADRESASVAGRVEAGGELHGFLDDFSLRTDLRGWDLAYDGYRFDALTGEVTAQGLPHRSDALIRADAKYGELRSKLGAHVTIPDPATVVLGDVLLEGPGTKAQANLRVGLENGSISGTLKADSEDLSRWRAFVGHGVGGRLAADLTIVAAAPSGAASASASTKSAPQGIGRVSGSLSLRDGSFVLPSGEPLTAKSVSATAGGLALGGAAEGRGTIEIVGARGFGVTVEKASLVCQGDGKRWRVTTTGSGSAGDVWSLEASATLGQRPVGFDVGLDAFDAMFGEDAVKLEAPVSLLWSTDSVVVGPTAVRLGDAGHLRGSAEMSPKAVKADLNLEGVPLSLVSFLAPDLGLQGSLSGSASLRGSSPASAAADVHVEAKDLLSRALVDNGVAALDAVADAHWEKGRLKGDATLQGVGEERFRLAMDAPVGGGARDTDPVSASLRWRGDLADLAPVLPIGEDLLKGPIRADLELGGSVASPLLSGGLTISGATYENAVTGLVLHDLDVDLGAEGSSLLLRKLTASDGEKGRIDARGRIGFARLPAFDADLEVDATDAVFARLDLVTAKADARLVIGVRRLVDAADVEGTIGGLVKIKEARIHIPDRFAAAIPELTVINVNVGDAKARGDDKADAVAVPANWTIALDVAVQGDNRVYVEGRGLDSEWSTDLHVGGDLGEPRITGLVKSVRGRLGLLGKRFDVTNAELRFDGAASGIPYLTLTAKADANDITAIIDVSGPATTPNVELHSEPALPRDDVLSRLLFGKSASGLTPMQSVQVAQSLAELTGNNLIGGAGLIDKLGRTLGLDRLGVEAGSGNGGSALTASKYLTDKVYLRVQQGLTPEDSKLSVEWEILKSLRIESDVSQDAQGEVGILWHWDY